MPDAAEPWWVKWACGCHDAQPTRAELPDRCPGHAAAPADPPRVLWSTNRSAPDQVECGHRCGHRFCTAQSHGR